MKELEEHRHTSVDENDKNDELISAIYFIGIMTYVSLLFALFIYLIINVDLYN